MLDSATQSQLKSYLEKITYPIELVFHADASVQSNEMESLLTTVASLSHNVIVVMDGPSSAVRAPSFGIRRAGEIETIRFAAIPMGHEFSSLILALLQVGGHPVKLDEAVIKQIAALPDNYSFETYISLSCQNCPEVVQALNIMAVINPRIKTTVIDGALFQAEVESREVMAVPSVFMNGVLFHQGRTSVEDILAKLDTGASARKAQTLSTKEIYEVLIVGGGPAGAAAAVYSARKGIRTGIIAERFGGQVLDTMGIENFISVKETDGPHLSAALEQHVKAYEVDLINNEKVVALQAGDVLEVRTQSGAVLRSKSIILATGARWREINVPGEKEYKNKGVAYCPHCDGPLFKGKRVAVVGGGNSGVEAAIDLAGLVAHVTLLEFDSKLKADAVLVRKLESLRNVTIITSAQTSEIHGDGSKVNALTYQERKSGNLERLELEGVFVQIGLIPNTEWLKDVVALTKYGEIEVDARGHTSVKGVFAAGDVTTTPFKQIIIAAGEGAKASLSAFDYLIRSTVPEKKEELKAA